VCEYDRLGRCVAEAFFDSKGAASVNAAGVHRFVYRFPKAGEWEAVAHAAGGKPAACSDTGVHRSVVRYRRERAEEERLFFGVDDGPVIDRSIGVHRTLSRYNAGGAVEEERFFDVAGRPAWHRQKNCLRVTRRFDQADNLVEVLRWVRL